MCTVLRSVPSAIRLFIPMIAAALALLLWGSSCDRVEAGSPEAVADAFADAYFRRADQEKAKEYTAFGATKMLDQEIAEVRGVRGDGYDPAAAQLDVAVERGQRSTRDHRVRFDYLVTYRSEAGEQQKHADIELSQVDGAWKVVRVGLSE